MASRTSATSTTRPGQETTLYLFRGKKKIKENLDAVKTMVNPEDVAEARRITNEADPTVGGRYPPAVMSSLFADTPDL
ncbi:unnamed protein product [Cyclocybe aegerita]|uniref:Uncharacterized protein n=1 Tax=Cyclocybe aegerita TaxID=1973307 RepID=A0A8S0VQ21_CYCAE|nr:unnamed protein product [Cyclocybe aegerita]